MDETFGAGLSESPTESQRDNQTDRAIRQERGQMDEPPALDRLPRFSTVGRAERANLLSALYRPLSGYLGGIHKGGYWVSRLSDEWSRTFGSLHSIPCNSATSGLLAACL